MNNLLTFTQEGESEIRALTINNEPFFIGRDVCLFFGDKNSSRSLARVDEADKRNVNIVDNLGRPQVAIAINESGLYSLLFAMQPQKAHNGGEVSDEYPIEIQERIDKVRNFKRWVTSEVLPAIRKDGGYLASKHDDTPEQILARAVIVAQETINRQNQKVKALETKSAQQTQIIAELQPKASYYDLILHSKELQPITKIAKDYGLSGSGLNKILCELGIQYKLGDTWLLYQRYAAQGYTQSKTHIVDADKSVMHTYWTQKGRIFIYDLLKRKKGILPMIEQELTA